MTKAYMLKRMNLDGHKIQIISRQTVRVFCTDKRILLGSMSAVYKQIYGYN